MCLTILSITIMISYFNTILSEVTTYSFILQAMAKAKDVFMSKKVVLSNKNLQPTVAIGINCFMAYFMATFIPNEKDDQSVSFLEKALDGRTTLDAIKSDLNEYKRRQSPVGVRLTKRGFGRDRRYPITSFWPVGD